ncbi:ABC transporter substrate-binding protein [soil metagenome]
MRGKRSLLKMLAALTALMLLAAACGGGGEEDDAGTGGDVATDEIPEGGTLSIAGASDVDYMDPASMYYTLSWFLARGTFRTLVTFPTTPDLEAQNELVPDLASNVGDSNEDATEWTFQIKDGVTYGPALGGEDVPGVTGEEIVCDDFKYGLERVFIPSVGGGYPFYYEVLEGASEFADGKADEISGIECASDKEIVYHLTEPTGDWPSRVAMPAAGPVPQRFAEKFDKKKDSDYDNNVIATGPYYVDKWTPGELIHAVRNPEWDQATDDVRGAYVDEIDWKLGFDNDVGVQKVLDGDYQMGMDVSPQGPALQKVVQDPELKQNLINEPSLCTRYLFLNTTVEPFDDPAVREAVNLAIDRANIKRVFGGPITGDIATSIVPPGMGGYLSADEYNPFGSEGMQGDMEQAKQMMADAGFPDGFDEEVLMVGASDPPHDKIAETVRADLEELGFTNLDVKLPAFPNQYTQFYGIPDKNVGIGTSAGWCKDYNDAFTFLDPLFHGDNILQSGNQNYSEIDDPELNAAIDEAAALPPGDERVAAWVEANKMATESGVWVPWSWDKETILQSGDLVNPIYTSFVAHIDWTNVGVSQGQ